MKAIEIRRFDGVGFEVDYETIILRCRDSEWNGFNAFLEKITYRSK